MIPSEFHQIFGVRKSKLVEFDYRSYRSQVSCFDRIPAVPVTDRHAVHTSDTSPRQLKVTPSDVDGIISVVSSTFSPSTVGFCVKNGSCSSSGMQ